MEKETRVLLNVICAGIWMFDGISNIYLGNGIGLGIGQLMLGLGFFFLAVEIEYLYNSLHT